jgi:branched-chain amino acid transport system ATP-binding protein
MNAVFEAAGISVSYGAHRALDSVDIALEPGVLHAVIGPNGAGKSTFIDALSGRARLTGGRMRLDGHDITGWSVARRRRHGISRSFQRTSVFSGLTVGAQLELVAARHREKDLDQLVAVLGLGPFLDAVCREVAYGTQRSVDLALALIGGPRVVLLDEPCAGLVADESAQVLEHIRRLCDERHLAVLLVEHDVEGVFRTADRVTVLNLGTVLASGTPDEVRTDAAVVRAYLGSAA